MIWLAPSPRDNASVLNHKSAISCRRSVGSAESLDGGEYVIGGFDPPERLRRGVVVVKKGVYRGFEFVDTAMYTAPDLLLGEQCGMHEGWSGVRHARCPHAVGHHGHDGCCGWHRVFGAGDLGDERELAGAPVALEHARLRLTLL